MRSGNIVTKFSINFQKTRQTITNQILNMNFHKTFPDSSFIYKLIKVDHENHAEHMLGSDNKYEVTSVA